jgi:hypothetical protein
VPQGVAHPVEELRLAAMDYGVLVEVERGNGHGAIPLGGWVESTSREAS